VNDVGMRLYSRSPMTPGWFVRSGVLAAVRALSETHGASVGYLRRGWLYGPHIEIVGRVDEERSLGWAALAELVDPPLPAGPDALTEEAYLDRARELGRLEGVAPPYLPMRPHGTLEWLRAEDVALWPQPLDALREAALTRLTRPVVATLEELAAKLATDRTLATVRLAEAFMALAGAHRAGAQYGVFSLRSHAEAFLAWVSPRADARPAFDRRLDADTDLLRPIVERALIGRPEPTAARWDVALAACMGLFEAGVLSGSLSLRTLESLVGEFDAATMGPPGGDGAATAAASDFHRAVHASGLIDDPPEWFAAYRTVVNLFYQQLPLLGVSAMQRYYLCYAIANLVDATVGEPWQARVDRLRAMRVDG
jgi:hypothetical protein